MKEALKFVRRFRPEYVLSENVSGIKEARHDGVWQRFCLDLERLGDLTGTKVICASKFGIFQYKKRLILLAAREDVDHPP